MVRMAAALALAAMASATAAARGGDTSPTYSVRGDGGISCATWTQERKDDGYPALMASDWVLGYLTAYDRYASKNGDLGGGVDNNAVAAWVDTYCAAHPLDNLATAAGHLIDALGTRNQ